jgi:hypothetical protein
MTICKFFSLRCCRNLKVLAKNYSFQVSEKYQKYQKNSPSPQQVKKGEERTT